MSEMAASSTLSYVCCFICNKKIIFDNGGSNNECLTITCSHRFESHSIRCHPECFFSAAGSDYRKALLYDKMVSKSKETLGDTIKPNKHDDLFDSIACSGSISPNFFQYQTGSINLKISTAAVDQDKQKITELKYKVHELEYQLNKIKKNEK